MSTAVTREDCGGVAHVQFNRPEARNAINDITAQQLAETFAAVEGSALAGGFGSHLPAT